MEGSGPQRGRRTVTPAVLAAALFAAGCAAFAVAFVASRGGLEMPVAAVLSPLPSQVTAGGPGSSFFTPTAIPATTPSSAPTVPGPSAPAASAPGATAPAPTSPAGTPAPGTEPPGSPDPLVALAGCPGVAGCYEYVIQRGDALSSVASRYLVPVLTVLALNPEITDPSTIVVGQTLYLGRDPFLRLEPCADDTLHCSLYVVRPGDLLSAIANRYGITVEAILAANASIADPNAIFSGQTIRLPHPG